MADGADEATRQKHAEVMNMVQSATGGSEHAMTSFKLIGEGIGLIERVFVRGLTRDFFGPSALIPRQRSVFRRCRGSAVAHS